MNKHTHQITIKKDEEEKMGANARKMKARRKHPEL